MPWDSQHKQQSRQKILDSAAELFTCRGYDDVGIDQVMQNADMTRGAFYSHFSSKGELYSEAITQAAINARDRLMSTVKEDPSLQDFMDAYLSEEHRNEYNERCPLSALVSDVSQKHDPVRETYTKVFKGFLTQLRQSADITKAEAVKTAILMIGGMAIARAVTDDTLSKEILSICRES